MLAQTHYSFSVQLFLPRCICIICFPNLLFFQCLVKIQPPFHFKVKLLPQPSTCESSTCRSQNHFAKVKRADEAVRFKLRRRVGCWSLASRSLLITCPIMFLDYSAGPENASQAVIPSKTKQMLKFFYAGLEAKTCSWDCITLKVQVLITIAESNLFILKGL